MLGNKPSHNPKYPESYLVFLWSGLPCQGEVRQHALPEATVPRCQGWSCVLAITGGGTYQKSDFQKSGLNSDPDFSPIRIRT